jgi:dTDP-4-amino-4,6-dideoxygalactose transaminase
MKIIQSPRASAIVYQLLKSRDDQRPWLLPANICPIVPITFLKAEIPFAFVDISAETLHMDWDQAEAEIKTRRIGGVLYAHTYGEASTPEDFFQFIKDFDDSILIVDDRCLCIPDLEADPEHVADVQLYSTGYAKIAELGNGGYAFIKDHVDYQMISLPFDARAHDEIEETYKYALNDRSVFQYQDSDWLESGPFPVAWEEYSAQIKSNLARSLDQRARLNKIYSEQLPLALPLPAEYQTWRFNISVENKADVLAEIFKHGLFASSHYASLAGIMAPGQCPVAEKLHSSVINLFNDNHFNEARAEKICKIIQGALP